MPKANNTTNTTDNTTDNATDNTTNNATDNATGNITGNTTGNLTGNTSAGVIGNNTNRTGSTLANLMGNMTGNITGIVLVDISDEEEQDEEEYLNENEVEDSPNAANDTDQRNLAFMHVPYNFGHAIEMVAMMEDTVGPAGDAYMQSLMRFWKRTSMKVGWDLALAAKRERGEIWGHLNPDLQLMSTVTGCPMYYTPQKYWPQDLAETYFGDKEIFGLLRDPYERVVAFFRGNFTHYGGNYTHFQKTCDVNGAVKQMLRETVLAGKKYAHGCTFTPQAEYFEGDYGIELPVNNREFPKSMNDVFHAKGYGDFKIDTEDIFDVSGCPEIWAGDLDAEAKALVRQAYAADFELLCKHFGYCDKEEYTCIYQIPGLCPKRVIAAGYQGKAIPALK